MLRRLCDLALRFIVACHIDSDAIQQGCRDLLLTNLIKYTTYAHSMAHDRDMLRTRFSRNMV